MKKLCLLVASLIVLAGSSNAFAYQGWNCGGGYPFGWTPSWNYNVNNRLPPYYAVHPPVYYSGAIVRIPYGNSPFIGCATSNYVAPSPAYGGAMPVATVPSLEIANPHYVPGAAKLPAPVQGASLGSPGVMIANPYYRAEQKVAVK